MFGAPKLGKKTTPYAFRIDNTVTTYRAVGNYPSLATAKREAETRLKAGSIKSYRIDKIGNGYLLNVATKKRKGFLTNAAADMRELY